MAASAACAICCDSAYPADLETTCCGQCLCRVCLESITDRALAPKCPYCRRPNFEARPTSSDPNTFLEGVWDVRVKETSPLGSTEHSSTIEIRDRAGSSSSSTDYLDGGSWHEVSMGHTSSGKSFSASQKLTRAPEWIGDSARVCGRSRVTGRKRTPTEAEFRTVVTLTSPDGDMMEIVQEGWMTRRE